MDAKGARRVGVVGQGADADRIATVRNVESTHGGD
jgi:hypothetical protein